MDVQIIEKTGDDGDEKSEADPEIKGMQGGEHIVNEKKTIVEIRVPVDQRKYKKQIKYQGNQINRGQSSRAAEDKDIQKYAVS